MSLARGSKEAAIPGVRDQLLVALLEGGAQAVEDGGTLGRVTLEADYVSARLASWSPVADHHSLTSSSVSPQRARGMTSGAIGLRSVRTMSRTSLSLRSRAPRMYSRPSASNSAIVSALII